MTPSDDQPAADSASAQRSSPAVRSDRPMWRRAWFWIVVALVVAGVAYGIHYANTKASSSDAAAGARSDAGAGGGQAGGQGGAQGGGRRSGREGGGGRGGAGGGAGGAARPLPVIAEDAKLGTMDVFLSALGSVAPTNSVTVRSRVDGQLMRIAFREGQTVRAGDLLAEIDPRQFQVQLAQAEGQLAKDQALVANARADVERYQMLFAQDSIARQQLDTQIALVRQYEGTIKADQAQVEAAKLQLSYARVTAPIAGRLGLKQVDVGNVIRSGDANGIVVITQVRPINVVFTLPEDTIARVVAKLRSSSRILVDAYDREQKLKLATGALASIDNQIDPTTGTYKLKAQFANNDESLFPNQFVNVRLLIDTVQNAVLVPTAALQRGAAGIFVYVVNNDQTVSVRTVTPGPALGEVTSIAQGLKAGEKVVTDGADKLREGGKVEVITREQQAAPGPGARRGGGQRGQGGAAGVPGVPGAPGAANAPGSGGTGNGKRSEGPTGTGQPPSGPAGTGPVDAQSPSGTNPPPGPRGPQPPQAPQAPQTPPRAPAP